MLTSGRPKSTNVEDRTNRDPMRAAVQTFGRNMAEEAQARIMEHARRKLASQRAEKAPQTRAALSPSPTPYLPTNALQPTSMARSEDAIGRSAAPLNTAPWQQGGNMVLPTPAAGAPFTATNIANIQEQFPPQALQPMQQTPNPLSAILSSLLNR